MDEVRNGDAYVYRCGRVSDCGGRLGRRRDTRTFHTRVKDSSGGAHPVPKDEPLLL